MRYRILKSQRERIKERRKSIQEKLLEIRETSTIDLYDIMWEDYIHGYVTFHKDLLYLEEKGLVSVRTRKVNGGQQKLWKGLK